MKIPSLDLQAELREIRSDLFKRTRRVLTSGRYILGTEVSQFERSFADFVGAKYAVGVASGSDALLLALMAFGVKQGDEVITTPFSFIATATAIARLGAKPVFVDIEPGTFNLDPALIRKKITRRTRAIIPVHLYGNPCRIDEILKIAKRFGLFVVEDCAQACGAVFKGKQVGSFGDFGAFSFYPTKTIGAAGDGGALTTNNKKLFEKIKSLHLHGEASHDHSARSYHHPLIGINSRLDEIQAAVLNVKLKYLKRWNEKRRQAAARYDRLFTSMKKGDRQRSSRRRRQYFLPVPFFPIETTSGRSVYQQYVIRAPKRDALLHFLKRQGIAAAVYYPLPLHLQPCFKSLGYRKGDFPKAEKASQQVLTLPLYPQIQAADQKYVIRVLTSFLKSGR
ncbi:MAG: DegT/DnrJ/EryC1/StrS family aminotransferase [Candidatus Omnitrophica bacterium]|nr:DegT/DnrJ/EryC1/StrS family aminotransferase [Candidatus Omnitrophota bacterium]